MRPARPIAKGPAGAFLALAAVLAAACGPADGPPTLAPRLDAIVPSCADSAVATSLVLLGSMPVRPEVSLSDSTGDRVDTTYRAWVGTAELTAVSWSDLQRLSVTLPPGVTPGSYPVTVQSPFGTRSTKEAALEVRQGACPFEGAVLAATAIAAPATVVVGDRLTVTATVRNDGAASALAVAAAIASAPPGVALAAGPSAPQDVPAGQERTFTWTCTATAPGGGVFTVDAAGISGDSGLPVAAPRASTNAVLVTLPAFMTASTAVTPGTVGVGQSITVALTVTNHATAAAHVTPDIVATGPIQGGNTPAAFDVAAGSAHTFVWTYTASAAGEATFTASASGADPGTGTLVTVPTPPASAIIQAAAALGATIGIPPQIELAPATFTVTMTVSNGGGATAEAVVPDTPVPQSPPAGTGAVVALASGPTGAPATIAAGQTATFTWVFQATQPGTLVLAAAAHGIDSNTGAAVSTGVAVSNQAAVGLHTVGGAVSGLSASGLTLRNGEATVQIAAHATSYAFPVPLATGTAYAVTIAHQPAKQTCTLSNATGTVGAADVTDVDVACSKVR